MFIHYGPFPARRWTPPCAMELGSCRGAAEPQPCVGARGWNSALPLLPLSAQLLPRFTFPYSKFPPCPVKILHRGCFFLGVLGFSGSNSPLTPSVYFFPLLIIRAPILHPGWSLKGELLPLVLSTAAPSDRGALERWHCSEGGRGLSTGTVGHGSLYCYFKRNPIPNLPETAKLLGA